MLAVQEKAFLYYVTTVAAMLNLLTTLKVCNEEEAEQVDSWSNSYSINVLEIELLAKVYSISLQNSEEQELYSTETFKDHTNFSVKNHDFDET